MVGVGGSSPLAPTKPEERAPYAGAFLCLTGSLRVDAHHRPAGSGLRGPSMGRALRARCAHAKPRPAVSSSPLAPTKPEERAPYAGAFLCLTGSLRVDAHHRPAGSGLRGPSMGRVLRARCAHTKPRPVLSSRPLAPTRFEEGASYPGSSVVVRQYVGGSFPPILEIGVVRLAWTSVHPWHFRRGFASSDDEGWAEAKVLESTATVRLRASSRRVEWDAGRSLFG